MQISVKAELDHITRNLTAVQRKHVPFAASMALNDVAFHIARKQLPKDADRIFDKGAVAFTKRGFLYKRSDKHNLTAEVYVANDRLHYMKHMIRGGMKKPAGKALLGITRHTKLNQKGNITRRTMDRMINDRERYFTKDGKLWQRYGRGMKKARPVLTYKKSRNYKPQFPLNDLVQDGVSSPIRGFSRRFWPRFTRALASAK